MEVKMHHVLQIVPGCNEKGWKVRRGAKLQNLPDFGGKVPDFSIKLGIYRIADIDSSYAIIESPSEAYVVKHSTIRDIRKLNGY